MKITTTPTLNLSILAVFATTLLAGCSFQTYSPKPIDPVHRAMHYRAHDPYSTEFRDYAIAQGYPAAQLPIKQWGLRELTLCALFFHPQLDVARATLRAAQAAEITAGQRLNPNLFGSLGHSQDAAAPWVYSLGIDIPIKTAGKREASIAQAENLSAAARIDIGQTAWTVRSRLLNSWIEYNAALQRQQLLQQELDMHSEIVAMLDARLDAGMISSVDISIARLRLQKTQQALVVEQGRIPQLRAALAGNTGLATETFNQLHLVTADMGNLGLGQQLSAGYNSNDLQDAALLNRLDLRAALMRYDAAESRLRLEIARQYPDLTLSPSHIYEEGHHIWSLGLAALLPLLNKNEGLIAEARALREVEAAQFDALQAQAISNIEQAQARYHAAIEALDLAHKAQAAQQARMQQIAQQFTDGYADRLELTTTKLEGLLSAQNLLGAEYEVRRTTAALEDAMQQPLADLHSLPNNVERAVSGQTPQQSTMDPAHEP